MAPAQTHASERLWTAAGAVAAAIAIACLVGACAGSGARTRTERQTKSTPSQAPDSTPVATSMGPRTPEAQEQPEAGSASGTTAAPTPAPAATAQNAPAEAPRPAAGAAARVPNGSREDGRPDWWFADPRRSEERVQLCAEALGVDMAAARDAALQAARARLRRELGLGESGAIHDEQIERAWVWPLPNSRVGPSRYAGYVLISAAPTDAD